MKKVTPWVILALCFGANIAYAVGTISETLSLNAANNALIQSGGMVGNIFAVGDNRYQVRRSKIVGKKGSNVFVAEIEIAPLPKHGNQ